MSRNGGRDKSNKVTFEERVSIVTEMLLAGLKRREIIGNISKNKDLQWNVSTKQIDKYIEKANKIILAPVEKDREKLVSKFFSRYDFLYKKLVNTKDYKGAASVTEKTCNLVGLLDLRDTDKDTLRNPYQDAMIEAINKANEEFKNDKDINDSSVDKDSTV